MQTPCQGPFLDLRCAAYEDWESQNTTNPYFGSVMESIQWPTIVNKTPLLDYTVWDGFFYKLNQLCVPDGSTHFLLIKEARSSSYEDILVCRKLCYTYKGIYFCLPCKNKWKITSRDVPIAAKTNLLVGSFGLHQHLPVPSRDWKPISVDSNSGLLTTKWKHDCIFVAVCKFSKIIIFIACNKSIDDLIAATLFF